MGGGSGTVLPDCQRDVKTSRATHIGPVQPSALVSQRGVFRLEAALDEESNPGGRHVAYANAVVGYDEAERYTH